MLLNSFCHAGGRGHRHRFWEQGDRHQAEKIISNSFTVLMFALPWCWTIGFCRGGTIGAALFGAAMPPCRCAWAAAASIAGSVFKVGLGMNPFIPTQGAFAKDQYAFHRDRRGQ